jgi:hypothetical protein
LVLWKKLFIISCVFFLYGCGNVGRYNNEYSEEENILFFLADSFLPQPVVNTYRLRNFISSDFFANYKTKYGDRAAIDQIFKYALWITDNDISQSLFISSIATLPYKKTPAKLPVINFDVMFYFSLESDYNFKKRFDNLPSHFLVDSPTDKFGDKDKLPHFFGSSFLSYSSDTGLLSQIIGDLIELGEAFFSLEGYNDERDKKMNKLGAKFGLDLLRNNYHTPSYYMGKWEK